MVNQDKLSHHRIEKYTNFFLLVPVCGLAWHSMKASFLIAFIDGVVIMATRESESVKTVQAHEVGPLDLKHNRKLAIR